MQSNRAPGARVALLGFAPPFSFGAAHVLGAGSELRFAWLNGDYHDHAPIQRPLDAAQDR